MTDDQLRQRPIVLTVAVTAAATLFLFSTIGGNIEFRTGVASDWGIKVGWLPAAWVFLRNSVGFYRFAQQHYLGDRASWGRRLLFMYSVLVSFMLVLAPCFIVAVGTGGVIFGILEHSWPHILLGIVTFGIAALWWSQVKVVPKQLPPSSLGETDAS